MPECQIFRSNFIVKMISIDEIEREIEKAKDNLQKAAEDIVVVQRNKTNEELGESLLEAFLNDKPFDLYSFALAPVKLAFIDAAFKTCDMEIVETCFGIVQQSMDSKAFLNLIQDYPQYMKIYNKIHKPTILRVDQQYYNKDNLNYIEQLAKDEQNLLTKRILEDQILRINEKTFEEGRMDVDDKWDSLRLTCQQKRFAINPSDLMKGKRLEFLSRKPWKTAIDPYQGARMALHWRAPQVYVDKFVAKISDPKEKAFFPKPN